eukprot:7242083-Lingulodinium_polyedra.AAC.1
MPDGGRVQPNSPPVGARAPPSRPRAMAPVARRKDRMDGCKLLLLALCVARGLSVDVARNRAVPPARDGRGDVHGRHGASPLRGGCRAGWRAAAS